MLALTDIGKAYGATLAVNRVSLEAAPGTVLGLVGENGAGKSTLLKIVSGAVAPDSGQVTLDGRPVAPRSTRDALALGIASVFQELTLVRELSVEQNLFLTDAPQTPWRSIDRRRLRAAAAEVLGRYGLDIASSARVADLPLGQQQMLEIVRAVERKPRALLLDEATSALGATEVDWLANLIDRLRDAGTIVLFISHRWDEIVRFCTRVAVLRNGELMAVANTGDLPEAEAVRLMTGHAADDQPFPPKGTAQAEIALSGGGVTLRRGQILGLGGLVGQGQGQLLESFFRDPSGAMCAGIAYVPQERKVEGLLLSKSVGRNMTLAILNRLRSILGIVAPQGEAALTREAIARARIVTRGPNAPVRMLSGGNQQKVLLEKWLLTEPKVLLLNDVTRGVDVGTKRQIYEVIAAVAARGVGVLWYSTDARELVGVAHRVLVMRAGRVSAELAGLDLTVDRIVHAAVMGTPTDAAA